MSARQKFGFFCESDPGQNPTSGRTSPWHEFPDAVIAIHSTPGGAPRMASISGDEGIDPQAATGLATLELIEHGVQSYIALMAPPNSPIRVNGMRPGAVSILNVKDQLQVAADHVWHMSSLHKPRVEAATADEIGKECPLCRTRIVEGQTLFHCTYCGAAIHCGAPHRPEHDRLECAKVSSECPNCHHPLVREERFEYVPDI